MAAQRGFARNLRLGLVTLGFVFGTGVLIPPPASAAICNGLPATIDLEGQTGPAYIVGTDGDDVIHGTRGNDQIVGLGGDDVICGDKGMDTIEGGPGRDTLLGDGSGVANPVDLSNHLMGGTGGDHLTGGVAADILRGGPGHDHLYGGGGIDDLYGNDEERQAPDYLDGQDAADRCFGNAPDTLVAC
jgi:Ca2+-binding RTX toxin-like protein